MKILGYDYKLIEDGDDDIIGAYGRFHAKRQILQIAEGLTRQQRESTVLHEVLEALNFHGNLGLNNKIIMPLESGLYQVLTDIGMDTSLLTKELDTEGKVLSPETKAELDGLS